ncbi:helix-turn-helix transcriptional regulator [Streptomyces poonensis]|uniref:LuxR family transcriptional regulator n=1 Tax=Streptomyces poonensis TaxID=68255 RepID=A0A918PTB5_9ACTN|nr:LuxR family transcriptional regulator [Streptomyces poonensis]GGZ21288.1 LuxR family transcriptional regulator [Streptomyces poonensis]
MIQKHSLLERDHEIGLLRSALSRVRSGDGGLVMIEGARGLGKSSLLEFLRTEAEAQDCHVVRARGSEFEREFSWAVVRQLFDRCPGEAVGRLTDEVPTAEPADMAAALLNRVPLGAWAVPTPQEGEGLHSVLHGLYRLCRALSSGQPLLLLVDDAQWADIASLRFLSYLVNRLEGNSILVVLANTHAEHDATQDLLMAACASPLATFTRLAPLSEDGVRRMITTRLGRDAHARVIRTCFELTEGNPLHLRELLDEMSGRGMEPDESALAGIPLLTPARVTWEIRRRVSRLPANAVALARAVAVLDARADPQHSAHVAGLGEAEASEAAGCLRDAEVLRAGVPYRFQRPVLRQVVYAQMPARDRSAAHRRSARSLQAAGALAAEVAEHVLRTDPAADPWAADVLSSAALDAMKEGDPRTAIHYLRRALAEPPSADSHLAALADLGAAELRAHDPSAVASLEEALRRTAEPGSRCRIRVELGLALAASGRFEEALVALDRDPGDTTTESADGVSAGPARTVTAIVSRLAPQPVHGPAGPLPAPLAGDLRCHAAVEALCRGVPARRVRRIAASALRATASGTAHDMGLTPASIAAWTLAQCDDLGHAERVLADAARQAASAGHLLTKTTVESLRARVLYDTGRLRQAETAARGVLEHQNASSLRPACVPLAAAVFVHCLIERGRPDEAEKLLNRTGLANRLPESALFAPLRIARARLWIRLERCDTGLDEMLACRELEAGPGWPYPTAICEILPDGVRALHQVEGERAARRFALDELERARAYGAGRPLAVALRTCGELEGGAGGLALMEEADGLLAGRPDTLERARTLIALGSALRRAGQRNAARRRLTAGMELAHGIGATVLDHEAGAELRLAGVRLARTGARACAALTPAEERVAQKAVEGLSNREIAQALFVTVKTVEWHLSQAYAKLGIGRRSELSQALGGNDGFGIEDERKSA